MKCRLNYAKISFILLGAEWGCHPSAPASNVGRCLPPLHPQYFNIIFWFSVSGYEFSGFWVSGSGSFLDSGILDSVLLDSGLLDSGTLDKDPASLNYAKKALYYWLQIGKNKKT